MNVSLEYFLLIAREQSIARAAERLFITPQNLSNHIKRLETKYGTLFLRTPHFQLTAAGEALVRAAQNYLVIEKNLEDEIKALNGTESVYVRMGIHSARARMLLPYVLTKYKEKFPAAKLIFNFKDVKTMEQMLHNGELDFFFSIDSRPSDDFKEIFLCDEPTYFVASGTMLREKGVNPYNKIITLEELTRFQYLMSPEYSRMYNKLDLFSRSNGIKLDTIMTISDFETQIILTSQHLGACFIPKMFIPNIDERNRQLVYGNKLFVFEIEKFNITSKLSLVTHKLTHQSNYVQGLIDCIKDYYTSDFQTQGRYKR